MVRTNDDSQPVTAIDECGQDSSRLVGHWKELAGLFSLQFDAQRGKPFDRLLDGERSEHVLDDVAIAEEIDGCHDLMRDIAAAAPRDEDLGPDGLGTID